MPEMTEQEKKAQDPFEMDPITRAWSELALALDLLEGEGQFDKHRHVGSPEGPDDLMCYLCVAEHSVAKAREILSIEMENAFPLSRAAIHLWLAYKSGEISLKAHTGMGLLALEHLGRAVAPLLPKVNAESIGQD